MTETYTILDVSNQNYCLLLHKWVLLQGVQKNLSLAMKLQEWLEEYPNRPGKIIKKFEKCLKKWFNFREVGKMHQTFYFLKNK
mgnify:CR=1 FL=1